MSNYEEILLSDSSSSNDSVMSVNEDDVINDSPEQPQHSPTNSNSDMNANGSITEGNTSGVQNVTGFQPVVDGDGNVTFQFLFNGAQPVQPLGPNIIGELVDTGTSAPDSNQFDSSDEDDVEYIPRISHLPESDDGDLDSLENEYSDYTHNNTSRNISPVPGPSQPFLRSRVGMTPPTVEPVHSSRPTAGPQISETTVTVSTSGSRSRRKQSKPKKRKGRTRSKKKKTPTKKVATLRKISEPKPLKPAYRKVISVEHGDETEFQFTIDADTVLSINISVNKQADFFSEEEPTIKLADIKLTFPEFDFPQSIDELLFGCKELVLHVSAIPLRSVLLLKNEVELSKEESLELGFNVGNAKREVKNIIVKKYYYNCQLDGFPIECVQNWSNRKIAKSRFSNSFSVIISKFDDKCMDLEMSLLGKEILGEHSFEEIPAQKSKEVLQLLNYYFDCRVESEDENSSGKEEDIPWFYGQIKKYHREHDIGEIDDCLLKPLELIPKLRDYQKKAVMWMLYREGHNIHAPPSDLMDTFQQKMYKQVSFGNWKGYYNHYIGYLCTSPPNIQKLPSGGILADEMGLGKTVEMLALILLNPKQGHSGRELSEDIETSMLVEEPNDVDDIPIIPTHPKRRRRRDSSPCEFSGSLALDASPVKNTGDAESSMSQSHLLVQSISLKQRNKGTTSKKTKNTRKRKVENEDQEEVVVLEPSSGKRPPAGTLLKQMQMMYTSTLSELVATRQAKIIPKFHGKFYETSLDKRAFFECICGEHRDDDRLVVTCIQCSTSQHPECVGFDVLFAQQADYICPHCTVLGDLIEANATLIITPSSISHQWIDEIQRHIDKKQLRILLYKGVSHHGYIPPYKLARYDIVITTYSVLSTEINYIDLPHNNSDEGRKFRNPKRFLTIPSPLPCVKWWRICLDEAQMVEGIHTKMALMAKKLQAVHRWCVSGTPLSKGLQDLYGLFSFLELSPIHDGFWWSNLVCNAFYEKDTILLYQLFGNMIWRTGKSDVLEQLGIPQQKEQTHWLNFSPIESHFYKQQFETCSHNLLNKIARLDSSILMCTKLSSINRQIIHNLLQPFLELRQACCHPQMVKGQLISLHKGTLTMEQLLSQLIKKCTISCGEDHRLMVAAWNGLAGLHIIRQEMVQASEMYRQVLQSADKYKEHFPTDSLQLLHTIENLADLIDGRYDGVPFTLRDDSLRREVEELKKKYLAKYESGVVAAVTALSPLTTAVEDASNSFNCLQESWWFKVLSRAAQTGKVHDLITRIQADLLEKTDKKRKNEKSMANKFTDVFGLENVLVDNITSLNDRRKELLKSLNQIRQLGPENLVDGAVTCHLRNQSQLYYNATSSATCTLCTNHAELIKYESTLFWEDNRANINRTGRKWQQKKMMGDISDNLTKEEQAIALLKEEEELFESTEHVQLYGKATEKSWQDSDTEKTLKILSNFGRLNGCSVSVIEDGSNHLKLYAALKKEYRFVRIVFRQLFDQVAGLDELNQATTRLRIRYDGEEVPTASKKIKVLSSGNSEKLQKLLNVHVVDRSEIFAKMEQMRADASSGEESLFLHMGQLVYLNSLKKTGYGKKGSFNTEECPICQCPLGTEWSVLSCAHSYCKECIKKICPPAHINFQCPLCRVQLKAAEISFVNTNEKEYDDTIKGETPVATKTIIGSHSTKVEAVIQQLLVLRETHPGEKVLVFSNWGEVLDILSRAFDQNDIKYKALRTQAFQKDLKLFKKRDDIQVLLIPLSFGAKGLNLIEATHVFLVEPILNKASELQAIGRVHRIGQTKPTFVHRFIIKTTIEEKLHEILASQDITSDQEGALTVEDLKLLVTQ